MSVRGSNVPCLCAGLLLLYWQSISRKKDLCFWSSPPGNSCSPLDLTGYFPFSSPHQFKHCSTAHCQKVHYNLGIQKTNEHIYIHTQSTENQKKPWGILHPSTTVCFLCCCWLHFGQAYSITEKTFTGICIDCTPQLPNYLFQDFSGAVPSAKYQSVYQAYAHGIYGLRDNRDSKLGLNFPHVEATYP